MTEDYLLETHSMCLLSNEQSILSRETIQNAFFFFIFILNPVFLLRLFILYQALHSPALAPGCGALVLIRMFCRGLKIAYLKSNCGAPGQKLEKT